MSNDNIKHKVIANDNSRITLVADVDGKIELFTFETFRVFLNLIDQNTIRRAMTQKKAVWGKVRLLQVIGIEKQQCSDDGCFVEVKKGDDQCDSCYAAELYEFAGRPVPNDAQKDKCGTNFVIDIDQTPRLHNNLF